MEKQWIPRETVSRAKQMDLLTYLQQYEPHELVRVSSGVYSTREHDSLKISHGKWSWWSRGIGGRSALDYLIKVKGMDFQKAVLHICDCTGHMPGLPPPKPPRDLVVREPLPFKLPMPYQNNDRVLSYLTGRGISLELLLSCVRAGQIYEDTRHNCVFVGKDEMGMARHGVIRSSSPTSTFLRDADGSDKRYSFTISANQPTDTVYLFESAIDLLSFITLEDIAGRDWQNADYLSLSGVYAPNNDNRELPLALKEYLRAHPQVRSIALCLDNDTAGHLAAQAIQERLPQGYTATPCFPASKDYNAQLMQEKGISGVKTRGDNQFCKEDMQR